MTGRDPMRQAAEAAAATMVCCTVGGNQYAFEGNDVRFIVRAERMHALPGRRADGYVGTLQTDTEVPVYALGARLGGVASASTGSHIVVTAGARDPIGWLVDRAVRSAHRGAEILPLPAIAGAVPSVWFKGLLRVDDQPYLMLSPTDLDPSARLRRIVPGAMFARPPAWSQGNAPPSVVVFSSPALPACQAKFAVTARQVAAVVQTLPSIPLPASPRHISALAWWRDAALPVLDFRGRTGRPDHARLRYLIVICGPRLQHALVAIPIEPDVVLHKVGGSDKEVVALTTPPPFVLGLFGAGREPIALLDVDRLASWRAEPPPNTGGHDRGPSIDPPEVNFTSQLPR